MDALAKAKEHIAKADEHRAKADADIDGGAYNRSIADREQKRAIVYAQIAQAQALTEIADLLADVIKGDDTVRTYQTRR